MDFNRIVARAKAILVSPKTEWQQIETEATSFTGLYAYVAILAAIPAVFGFIENSLIGRTITEGDVSAHFRIGVGSGIGGMVVMWVLTLIGVYVVALIVNALAATFGAQPHPMQALKTIAYANTAAWVAGAAVIIPWIGWLIMLAGALYSIYLLYLGLPYTMKCPPDKALAYTAATIIATIIVYIIIGLIVGAITGVSLAGNIQPGADVQLPAWMQN